MSYKDKEMQRLYQQLYWQEHKEEIQTKRKSQTQSNHITPKYPIIHLPEGYFESLHAQSIKNGNIPV